MRTFRFPGIGYETGKDSRLVRKFIREQEAPQILFGCVSALVVLAMDGHCCGAHKYIAEKVDA